MDFKLSINDTTKSIKDAFRQHFKGLKIEFFKHDHKSREGSPKADMVTEDTPLKVLCPNFDATHLVISNAMTVAEVEALFEEKLGLHIQLFRKTGINWIETTRTDHYTLEKQQEIFRETQHI